MSYEMGRFCTLNARRAKKPFTLIELVVTISIIVLTVAIVTAVFRKDSPAQALSHAENEFRAYCARVRYRACESGKDWVIHYDPETRKFSSSPGKFEKFEMPGGDGLASSSHKNTEEEEEDPDDPESESSSGTYAPLRWALPEKFEFATENSSEDTLMAGEKLELFRFFPDGGGSGNGYLEFKCGDLSRFFKITHLTGRLVSMDREELERGVIEQ